MLSYKRLRVFCVTIWRLAIGPCLPWSHDLCGNAQELVQLNVPGLQGRSPTEATHSSDGGHGGRTNEAGRPASRALTSLGSIRALSRMPEAEARNSSVGGSPIHTASSKPITSRTSVQPASPSLSLYKSIDYSKQQVGVCLSLVQVVYCTRYRIQ